MKNLLLLAVALTATYAAPLTIYNSGVDNANVVLAGGSTDPHFTSPGTTVSVLNSPNPAWVANTAISKWIGPDTGDGATFSGGVYSLIYTTTVDLTGFDPTTAVITGRWSTDNIGTDIKVNSTSTGNTSGGFGAFTSFTLNTGFTSGVNTINFLWANQGGPGGFRVEFTSASATPLGTNGVPEPSSIVLMLTGAAALAAKLRRS